MNPIVCYKIEFCIPKKDKKRALTAKAQNANVR